MFIYRARLLLTTLWVGSLWTIGYVVAPTLFASLSDRVLAGTIAGNLFRVEAWLSIACAILLIGLHWLSAKTDFSKRSGRELLFICVMLALTLIQYFGLQPLMAALRPVMHEQMGVISHGGLMSSEAKVQFGILHGITSALYLVESVMGLLLILKMQRPE